MKMAGDEKHLEAPTASELEEIKGPGWSQSTKLNADFLLLE